jgi:dihydroorotase
VIDPAGKLLPFVKELWDRGMVMDIGHGAGSFSFETAEAMLAEGMPPDVISTDIHQLAVQGPCFDLPTTMAKFLALGMSLESVVERATVRPARAVGLSHVGTLKVGAPADVALFRLREGDFTLYDVHLNPRRGRVQLDNTLTLVDGQKLPHLDEKPLMYWADNPDLREKVGPRP